MRRRRIVSLAAVAASALSFVGATSVAHQASAQATQGSSKIQCGNNIALCTEVDDPEAVFGQGNYVGHDEPSVLFDSSTPGTGNAQWYGVTLPTEPDTTGNWTASHSYTGELTPAFWFGEAFCDDQSYPEQVHTACTPDSDSNIRDPAKRGSYLTAPGAAYMEMQFYPPGFAPQWADDSCSATQWCAALTIDSLAEDPIHGTTLNSTCASQIGGLEYVNFAYITTNGVPNGPPNPKDFEAYQSGTPTETGNHTLFMNQGDHILVQMNDTPAGFHVELFDSTTDQTGFMTASAANHFGNITYAPTGTSCQENDTAFHPMYSTSSPATRVLWAAGAYNVAMDTEIGHVDPCSQIDANTATCTGLEGNATQVAGNTTANPDQEAADSDDYGCFSAAQNTEPSNPLSYCVGSNVPGFDAQPYQHLWPDGSSVKPTPFRFTTPISCDDYAETCYGTYSQYGLETDLPRNEASDEGGSCNRTTGRNCVNPPLSDDGTPANFYPFYSQLSGGYWSNCEWAIGDIDQTGAFNSFSGNSQEYGHLYSQTYWAFGGKGASVRRFNDFLTGPTNLSNACTWEGP